MFPLWLPLPLPFPPALFYEYLLYRLRVACQSSIWQIAENTIAETQTTFKCCYTLEQVEGERQVGVANWEGEIFISFRASFEAAPLEIVAVVVVVVVIVVVGALIEIA